MSGRFLGGQFSTPDEGAGPSGLHVPTTDETFSINNPQHRLRAEARLTAWGLSGSKEDVAAGKAWYPEAHDIVTSQGADLGLSKETAAGVTSVLSPGSDWSQRNVPALGQAAGLHRQNWDDIVASHASATADLERRRSAGLTEPNERVKRHPEIKAMLKEEAPALSGSSNTQLLKAHRILGGEHPESVIPRLTSPKTNAFYKGLLSPGNRGSEIPIDYRMSDVAANELRPYKTSRGIDKDAPKRGQTTSEYRLHEELFNNVGRAMAMRGGRQFAAFNRPITSQAYLWHLGKQMELKHPEAKKQSFSGEPYQGPPRSGQRYTSAAGVPSW